MAKRDWIDIDQNSFDLVLLDLALPGKNGLEILQHHSRVPAGSSGDYDHRLWQGG